MSLQEMREELRRKYGRLKKREERLKTMLKYYERIEAEVPPWLPPLKRKGFIDHFFSTTHSNPPELEKLIKRVRILAEYGKAPEAEKLMRKFALSYVLLSPRDFWNYLYDWTVEALKLLEAKKIEIEAIPAV